MTFVVPTPPADEAPRLEMADFAGREGEGFELRLAAAAGGRVGASGASVPLLLDEVLPLGDRIGVGEREAPFTLRFRGPRRPALGQRIYPLHHPDLGAREIFLVPIAEDRAGRTYEAVFT